MSLVPLSEAEIRAALLPDRVDPRQFEAGVRERLILAERRPQWSRNTRRSSLLNAVAALLPLQFFTGCQMVPGVVNQAARASVFYKLLALVAFPAISLCALVGAAGYSVIRIRRLNLESQPPEIAAETTPAELAHWWNAHWRGGLLVFLATLALSAVGATWLLFLFYMGSFGLLLGVLSSLAKGGLGNRLVISQFCALGLIILGQTAGWVGIGDNETHFLDQMLLTPVFFLGAGILFLLPMQDAISRRVADRFLTPWRWVCGATYLVMVLTLAMVFASPIIWPITTRQMQHSVETVNPPPASFIDWRLWEDVAGEVLAVGIEPDLSRARNLMQSEIRNPVNPLTLGTALRTGLVREDQVDTLRDSIGTYRAKRDALFSAMQLPIKPQTLTSLESEDWVIRGAVLRRDLTPDQCDFLAARLHVNLQQMDSNPFLRLEEPLRITQLLEAIGRPVDRDQYRKLIHGLLLRFQARQGGGFQSAGGFKEYSNLASSSSAATLSAVQLMEIYGIPRDLDVNWIRSYVRPKLIRARAETWRAAVTSARLERLPGITQPPCLEVAYHERNLFAALTLIGLCLYATLTAPTWDVKSTRPVTDQ